MIYYLSPEFWSYISVLADNGEGSDITTEFEHVTYAVQGIVKVDPPLASTTILNVNIGGAPPFNLTISVGTITYLQDISVVGGDGQLD